MIILAFVGASLLAYWLFRACLRVAFWLMVLFFLLSVIYIISQSK